MKGFRFRLEPVLSVRHHREEMLQRKLAESQRLLDAERSKYESIKRSIQEGVARYCSGVQPGKLNIGEICLESEYLRYLERELIAQQQQVEIQERRVAKDLNALLQASRDRKALERLKENQQLAYYRELTHKEQNRAEEAAITRHLLRQMGYEDDG
ncbi:MAG: flagellar export protein FliJ [Chloroflexota bacterium]